jgi:chromosome segregation ATPase
MSLFANLSMDQKKKLNELIEAINEKDELLDSQEDFLIKENKKIVKLKIAYAQEVQKCKNISKELSICHDSISSLRSENASLVYKVKNLNVCNDSISYLRDENARLKSEIEELSTCKPSTSTVDHVSICTRCRDINVEAIDDHLAMIKKQNDHIAKLDSKIVEHELENEKFKFACSMLYNGRRPGIKDTLVSNRGAMSSLMSLKIV